MKKKLKTKKKREIGVREDMLMKDLIILLNQKVRINTLVNTIAILTEEI